MNTRKYSNDRRSLKLDQMIQDAIRDWHNNFLRRKEEIIDFIMENPEMPITYDQIVFLLRRSSPAVNPMRKDYYDVLTRLVSEAKTHGDVQLVKNIYLSIPFYADDKDYQQKRAFYQSGIEYLRSLGLYQIVGELYAHLAGGMYGSVKERIILCERALEILAPNSKEYACVLAMREMFSHMEQKGIEEYYRYHAFGETIFQKENSVFLSPTFSYLAFCKKSEFVCFNVTILKGNRQSYETLTSFDFSGYEKEIACETMSVGTSKYLFEEKELIRYPDEKLICQADGKEYLCRVFLIRRTKNQSEKIIGDIVETNYYARGIGLIRSVISVDGKEYVYDLCEYLIKGGEGMIPCCVGNKWYYRQKDCPEHIDQVIKREIIAQNGEEYLISGWNYAGSNPS